MIQIIIVYILLDYLLGPNFIEGTVAAAGRCLVLVTPSGLRLPIRSGSGRVGDRAALFLRPEKITITAGGHGPESVEGEVAEAIYLGESTRYVVRAAGGDTFTVKQQNLSVDGALVVGARVTLRWDPEAAVPQRPDPGQGRNS